MPLEDYANQALATLPSIDIIWHICGLRYPPADTRTIEGMRLFSFERSDQKPGTRRLDEARGGVFSSGFVRRDGYATLCKLTGNPGCELTGRVHAEFAQNVLAMLVDGARADLQSTRDLFAG